MNKNQSKTSRNSRKISGIISYELNAPNLDDTIVNYRKQETVNSDSNYTEMVPRRKQAIVSYDGMLMVLDLVTPHRTVLRLTGTGTGTEDITAAAVYRDSRCNDGIFYFISVGCD
jgi:hypothetical protein